MTTAEALANAISALRIYASRENWEVHRDWSMEFKGVQKFWKHPYEPAEKALKALDEAVKPDVLEALGEQPKVSLNVDGREYVLLGSFDITESSV